MAIPTGSSRFCGANASEFIFQAFNLLPTLTAAQNIELPLAIAGKKPERAWYDQVVDTIGLRPRLGHLGR